MLGILLWIAIVLATISVFVFISNDTAKESCYTECANCGSRRMRKVLEEEKTRLNKADWRCSRCGNTKDEFGQEL